MNTDRRYDQGRRENGERYEKDGISCRYVNGLECEAFLSESVVAEKIKFYISGETSVAKDRSLN